MRIVWLRREFTDKLILKANADPVHRRMLLEETIVESAPPTEPRARPAKGNPRHQNHIKLTRLPPRSLLAGHPNTKRPRNEFRIA